MVSADYLTAMRTHSVADPAVLDYQRRIAAADHLLLVFPTWWMSMPAATKGFLDRVLTEGFAFDEPRPGGRLLRRLHRLRGVTVLTPMTTPRALYGTWFGAPARRILFNGTFRLIGIRRMRWISYSGPAQRSEPARQRMLDRTARHFARLKG